MPRLKLTVAYEGSNYSGWQLQAANGDLAAGPPTVQGELERCVRTLVGTRVPVHGAGRTDSGVHAEGQVCHLDLPEDTRRIDWRRAMNVQLPPDVRVLNATWVDAGFHARKSARGKRYAYTLWSHRERAVPRIRSFVWSCPPLDMEKLRPVFPCLVGTRDFATFRNSGGNDGRTIRTLSSIELLPGVAANLTCARDWPVTTLIFEGDGFLKQMVRNLMGLLVWVGQGKIDPAAIPDIIEARDRRALPSPSAPASGLTLLEVLY